MPLASLVHATLFTWGLLSFYVLFEACAVPLLLVISSGAGWHRSGHALACWSVPLRHKIAAAFVLAWAGFVFGSLATLRQVDLKKIVACSSIVHMAMLPLALFSLSEASLASAFLLMLAHGLVSPALFVLVGQLFDRYHTEFLVYLASRGSLMPVWRTFFLLLALANVGLPLAFRREQLFSLLFASQAAIYQASKFRLGCAASRYFLAFASQAAIYQTQ
jgi:NADH:ubiquinone oxidoreductase subunit 4 (subunit M)